MTLQEAIKSGRKFRSGPNCEWLERNGGYDNILVAGTPKNYPIGVSDLMHSNWEIEEEKIEISKEALSSALKECSEKYAISRYTYIGPIQVGSPTTSSTRDLLLVDEAKLLTTLGFKS